MRAILKSIDLFNTIFIPITTDRQIAFVRLVTFTILAYYSVIATAQSTHLLPLALRTHMGIMDTLYRFDFFNAIVANQLATKILSIFTATILGAAALGIRPRLTAAIGLALYLPLVGIERSYAWFNHAGLIPWYCGMALLFTRLGGNASIFLWEPENDRNSNSASKSNGWALFFTWTVIALPYLMAGLSKLRLGGLDWWSGENMQHTLFKKALMPDGADRSFILETLDWIPPWAFSIIGILTFISEVGMVLILFSRRARIALPLLCIGMHIGILFTMQIAFWDLIFLNALVVVDWKYIASIRTLKSRVQNNQRSDQPSILYFLSWTTLCILLMGNWVLRIEYFPLTSMQMFAINYKSTIIPHYKLYYTTESGVEKRAYLEEMGYGTNRYLPILQSAFNSDTDRESLQKLLERCSAYSAEIAPSSERITQFNLVKMEWNFATDRKDRKFGKAVDSITFPIPDETSPNKLGETKI